MSSILEDLQAELGHRLDSLEYFSDIPVLILRDETIEAKLDAALAGVSAKGGHSGAAVSVLMPLIDVPQPNVPGPQMEVVVTVRVQEIPLFNFAATGTQKSAEDIALQVLAALHHFRLEGTVETLFADKDAITPSRDYLPKITYDVKFRTSSMQVSRTKVELPVISELSRTVTLAAVTAGSTTYYTTDGSYPWSGNGAGASIYTTPFSVAAGTVVRWAGYKSGMAGSDIGRATIT